jgi:hypothetical protein
VGYERENSKQMAQFGKYGVVFFYGDGIYYCSPLYRRKKFRGFWLKSGKNEKNLVFESSPR